MTILEEITSQSVLRILLCSFPKSIAGFSASIYDARHTIVVIAFLLVKK